MARNRGKDGKEGLVRKETGWLTNSPFIAAVLEGVCSNTTGKEPWHRHVVLEGGLCKKAAAYPPALAKAVLQGLRQQLVQDGKLSEVKSFVVMQSEILQNPKRLFVWNKLFTKIVQRFEGTHR